MWPTATPTKKTKETKKERAAAQSAITFGSHVYALTPSGPLGHTATVEMALDRPAAAGLSVVVVTREQSSDPWTYLPAKLTADRSRAQFTTDHLSEYGAVLVDPDALMFLFKKYFLDGLTSGFIAEPVKPSCDREDEARLDGYRISSSSTDTLFWCFGYDSKVAGQKRVLKVVNTRPYLLMLAHPNMGVLKNEHALTSWSNLSRIDKRYAVVEPRSTVTFNADLKPGESEGVHTQFDGSSQNLYAAQTGFESLLLILTRLGLGSSSTLVSVADKAWSSAKCFDALDESVGALVSNCFSPADMVHMFGNVGLFLAPLAVVGSFGQFFKSSYRAVVDQFTGRDVYQVLIRRVQSFAAFQKPWFAHTSAVEVSRSGYTVERIGNGCCDPIIDLEYQLSNARRAGRAWVADATVIKVTLHDYTGRKPPRVGQTYGVRVVGPHYYGVAFPKFAFCEEGMANRDCGA